MKERAEAKIKEVRDTLDKDQNNIPDALEGLTEKAKTLAGQAQEKAKPEEVKGQAEKVVDSADDSTGKSDKEIKKG